MKKGTFKKLVITGSVISSVALLFTFCKKDNLTNSTNSLNSGFSILPDNSAARLTNSYSGVTFDAQLGMLEFASREVFSSTMDKLVAEKSKYQFDNGFTNELLQAINNVTNYNLLTDSLINNSPLSDDVLVAYMKKNIPPGLFKTVMFANADLTEKTAEEYANMSLPPGIRNLIDDKIKNHSPFVPGLSEFEKLFPNYISHRKVICDQEYLFLTNGGDPESPLNPKNISKLDLVEATLFNQYLEVKINGQIIKMLPEKSKNVLIKNGSADILQFIRQNGDVPRFSPSSPEPENGFPIAQAPPIIDPNIVIEPTNSYNNNCNSEVTSSPNGSERLSYSLTYGSKDKSYYWDFGDGFVSYQENPTHKYVGNATTYTVTVTSYDSQGTPCVGYSYGGNSTGTGGTGTGNSACATGNINTSTVPGFNSTINVFVNFTNYVAGSPIAYNISFGDGTNASGNFYNNGWNSLNHGYPLGQNQQYTISMTLTYNGCTLPLPGSIQFFAPPPPPSGFCCDKRDRDKDNWKTTSDNKNKYRHKLKLSNTIAIGGKFSADLNTYARINFFGGHIWVPANTYGCVGLFGDYWKPCTTNGFACDGTPQPLDPFPDCGNFANHSINWNPSACYFYITTDGMTSTATAYGIPSLVKIGTCP